MHRRAPPPELRPDTEVELPESGDRLIRRPSQKVVVAVVYVCGMLMNSLDSTIINVALATLAREFDVSPADVEAVVIAYLVSIAIFIPASGWLGDRFGTKRIFLLALAIFTGASMLCGAAQSLNQLVAFRVLQGAGGGLLTPVGMAMLYRTFPPEERIAVSRILMFALILGPASGPVIGGLLLEHLSWRWAFYVNIPVGLVAFVFGLFFLQEQREERPGGFDLPGFLLAAAGFGLLTYALTEGPNQGWWQPGIYAPGIIGAVILVAFVAFELRTTEPMVQLRLLANRLFRSTLLTSLFGTMAFIGTLFLAPLFLQEGRGSSPLTSGLATFPEAIGVLLATQVVARVYPRIGPRRLMTFGLCWVALAITLIGVVGTQANLWVFRGLMFMMGTGMACVFLPNQAASLATITREQTGRATTFTSVQRQLGAAFGVAILSSVLAGFGTTERTASGLELPRVAAYQAAFFAAAALAVIGALFALKVPDEDAAATMRPRRV
jgi:EmrB/QacA subfamily drug resistance transporter